MERFRIYRVCDSVWTIRSLALALALLILAAQYAYAQQPARGGIREKAIRTIARPLTNDDVIEMVNAGVPAETILERIRSSPIQFDLSSAELIRLRRANVPDVVIAQMIQPDRDFDQVQTKKRRPQASAKAAAPAPPELVEDRLGRVATGREMRETQAEKASAPAPKREPAAAAAQVPAPAPPVAGEPDATPGAREQISLPSLAAADSGPPPNSQSAFDAVDRAIAKMEWGTIAFNAPGSMNVNDTVDIQLVLALAAADQEKQLNELKQLIEAEGAKEHARIKVADRMEARLTGSGFAITAATPETQLVARNDVTQWKWSVKPTTDGRQTLHLTLSALLDVDGKLASKAIRTFDRSIEVNVTWQQRFGGFVANNWQWLWAVVLTPLAAWMWRRRTPPAPEKAKAAGAD